MIQASNVSRLAGLGFAALALAVPAHPALALQDDAQQACISSTARSFARVAAAEARTASGCAKAVAAGKAVHASVADCVAADAKGKVAKAVAKAGEAAAKSCTTAPDFGVADLAGSAAAAAGSGARLAILQRLFGTDVDAALATKAADKDGAACQAALLKAADRCWKARVAGYTACLDDGLSTSVDDAADMAACRDGDVDGDIDAACDLDLRITVLDKCSSLDLDALLPGCECQNTAQCVAIAVGNTANSRISDTSALADAATIVPDERRAVSAAAGPWISPEWGEFVAAHVVGREEDAPLACPLGAVNVYTIMDAMADAEYNAGITPLVVAQGIRILVSPLSTTDVTGASPVDLVQGTMAMPLYAEAQDFLRLATRVETHDLIELKHLEVGDTLRFGLQHCLHDCESLYAAAPPPNFVFGNRLLVVHFDADRATVESSVASLAAEAESATGVQLRWVGRTVGDFKVELVDGSVAQAFNALPADGTLIYELDPLVDPMLEVLTLPALGTFLSAASDEAVVLLE